MGELIHTRGFASTKRVAKILHFYQFMIHNLPPDCKEHYKYLMGTLFSIGGMLKLEAKSYLHTRKKEKESFHNVCQLFNLDNPVDANEHELTRELKAHDREFFENGFSQDIARFIRTIC